MPKDIPGFVFVDNLHPNIFNNQTRKFEHPQITLWECEVCGGIVSKPQMHQEYHNMEEARWRC